MVLVDHARGKAKGICVFIMRVEVKVTNREKFDHVRIILKSSF